MDDDEYYQKETYRIYKEEIKGIGITSLHYTINTENNEKYLCRFLNLKNYKENSSLYDEFKKQYKFIINIKIIISLIFMMLFKEHQIFIYYIIIQKEKHYLNIKKKEEILMKKKLKKY